MKSMVVLFALCAVACASSWAPLAQPPHHPAIVLDPHGRPLDTAEVIGARAVHLQAKALEHGHGVVAAPVWGHSLAAAPLLGHSLVGHGLYGHGLGHLLKKRSLALAHAVPVASHSSVSAYDVSVNHGTPVVVAHAAPVAVAHAAPIAVAAPVLAHSAWATPAIAAHGLSLSAHGLGLGHGLGHGLWKRSLGLFGHGHAAYVAAPVVAHAAVAPVVKYVGGSAVSHQSRVDVQTSPAVVAHSVVAPVVSHSVLAAPVVSAHSAWAAPAVAAHGLGLSGLGLGHGLGYGHGLGLAGHGHLLKKRSLAYAHGLPAVSHQSRVDVISSHAPVVAAPLAYAHAAPLAVAHAAPLAYAHAPAVSHQSRVDVISSHLAPVAHSAVWTAPAHLSHAGLLHGGW